MSDAAMPPAAATTAAAPQPGLLSILVPECKSVLLRRWKWLLLSAVVSAGLAYVLALMMGKQSWQHYGTLLYTPLPMPEGTKDFYVTPDMKTLTSLVKSQDNLNKVRDDLGLATPLQPLDASIVVTVPSGTKTVMVTSKWEDKAQGEAILQRLMEVYSMQVANLRKAKIQGCIADSENNLRSCQQRATAGEEKLRAFNRRENIVDLRKDMAHINDMILVQQTALEKAHREEHATRRQIKEMETLIARLKNEDKQKEADNKKFEAAEETVADNRRRQDRLRELIDEERLAMQVRAQLEGKRTDLNRTRELEKRGAASREDVEKLQNDIEVLEAKIRQSDKIREWRAELDRIDKVIVPSKKSVGSPIIQQTLTRKQEMDFVIIAIEDEISQLERSLDTKKKQLARMTLLLQEGDSLTKVVESADAERLRNEAYIASLRQLLALDAREMSIVQPATPSLTPVSSSRKLWMVGGFVGCYLLCVVVIVGQGLLVSGLRNLLSLRRLGLELLVRLTSLATMAENQTVMLLALKIRQRLALPGSLVLFPTVHPDVKSGALLVALASCMGRRDERVLVMDVGNCITPAQLMDNNEVRPGLADYLDFDVLDTEECVLPTPLPGVDWLGGGQKPLDPNQLATHRMRELVEMLQRKYTIILASAPPTDRQADLQILSAYADGLVFVSSLECGVTPSTRELTASLLGMGAPVLGVIT